MNKQEIKNLILNYINYENMSCNEHSDIDSFFKIDKEVTTDVSNGLMHDIEVLINTLSNDKEYYILTSIMSGRSIREIRNITKDSEKYINEVFNKVVNQIYEVVK